LDFQTLVPTTHAFALPVFVVRGARKGEKWTRNSLQTLVYITESARSVTRGSIRLTKRILVKNESSSPQK